MDISGGVIYNKTIEIVKKITRIQSIRKKEVHRMSKLSKEQFQAYLKQIRELAEGQLEEIQKEVEVTNKFPQEFYDMAIQNDLYRCALP